MRMATWILLLASITFFQTVQSAPLEVKSLVRDNKELSSYLSDLIDAFQDPKSCLGPNAVKVDSDGSVDIAQAPALAKRFRQACLVQGPGNTVAAATGEDYFNMLLKRNKGKPELDRSVADCSDTYFEGPYVISAQNAAYVPICFGVASCKRRDGTRKYLTLSCEAGMAEDVPYCPGPTACLESNKVNVWKKGIRILKK